MQAPCSIDINQKILRIFAANGRIIAEILVEGPFEACMKNAVQGLEIVKGRANIYRGELIPLNRNEYLDSNLQEIFFRDIETIKE